MSKKKGFDKMINKDLLKSLAGSPTTEPEKKQRGRPQSTHGKKRYTIIVAPEHITKMKIIAARENEQISEAFSKAVESYIKDYEKQNGAIKI